MLARIERGMAETHNPEIESAPAALTIEQLAGTDLVIGILADLSADDFAQLRADLRTIPGAPRWLVKCEIPRKSIRTGTVI